MLTNKKPSGLVVPSRRVESDVCQSVLKIVVFGVGFIHGETHDADMRLYACVTGRRI